MKTLCVRTCLRALLIAGIIAVAGTSPAQAEQSPGWMIVESQKDIDDAALPGVDVSITYDEPDAILPWIPERPVVVEQFTATWCPYCYSVAMALDRLDSEKQPQELLLIAYHSDDGYQTSFGISRGSYYSVNGIPTVIMNGTRRYTGGYPVSSGQNGIDNSFSVFAGMYNQENSLGDSGVDMEMFGEFKQTGTTMQIVVNTRAENLGSATLYVLAVEDAIPVNATNGLRTLNFVHRATLLSQTINLSSPTRATINVSYSGTISCRDATCLKPVVFLQDNSTRRIIAADATLATQIPLHAAAWESYQ